MSDPITRLNAALEGRYRIESELGEGGMATVYLADDLKHERKVALKVLKPELAAVVGAERFLAEIKTTANLQHPHILPLHDSGEADGFLYYVMPYIEGETLRERIDRDRQLPVDEALGIATAVAGALQTAHEQGVMSPEQATGDQAVGPASDTFALACVLYEMLVGEPPYPGNTAQAVLGKIIQGVPVSATAIRKAVPTNVDAAIRKALEKLPADRFTGAQGFAKALADPGFRHGGEVAAGVGPWKRLTIGLAGLAAGLSLALGWSLLRPDPPQPVSRQVVSVEGWAGIGVPLGRYAAVSPDGSRTVLPVRPGTDVQLGLKMRGSTEITPIPGTEGARDVVFSPDGQWIAYAVGTDLFKRPVVGGSPLRLAEDTQSTAGAVAGVAWLDDGTILYERRITPSADGRERRIVRISEDGVEEQVVYWPEENPTAPVWVHGLPDARGALVVTCPGTTCPATLTQLHIVDLEDLSSELVLEQVLRAWYAPTGHIVYVRPDGAVFAQPFDLGTLEMSTSAIPLFAGVRTTNGTQSDFADIVIGRDGTVLYIEGDLGAAGSQAPVWLDRGGAETRLDVTLTGLIRALAVAPDGGAIAFEYVPPEGGPEDIWTYDLEQGTSSRLTSGGSRHLHPFWSPDGGEVGFSSDRDGLFALYARPADRSTATRLVFADPEYPLYEGNWMPDGVGLVFRRGATGSRDVGYVADPDSLPVVIVETTAEDQNPALSLDGRWLAYISNESGQYEVYVRPFPGPGGQTTISTDGGTNPVWAHNGREIFYLASDGSLTVATVRTEPDFAVESRQQLFSWDPYVSVAADLHWDVAPDDERVLAIGTSTQAAGSARYVLVQNFFEELKRLVRN